MPSKLSTKDLDDLTEELLMLRNALNGLRAEKFATVAHRALKALDELRQMLGSSIMASDADLQIDVLRKALEKHVCVKVIQGDGMNAVEYYPVDEDECELCAVLKPKDGVAGKGEFQPKSTPYDTSGSRGEPMTPA